MTDIVLTPTQQKIIRKVARNFQTTTDDVLRWMTRQVVKEFVVFEESLDAAVTLALKDAEKME